MGKPATAENTAAGARIDMIGVPFDGMGRASGQAGAPEALRAAGYARLAVEHAAAHGSRWWLHIDLDVLARSEFAACGAAGEVMLAGGLTWQQLTSLAMAALHTGGCAGWSLSIYNPDLDPDHGAARSIVDFVARIAPSAARQHPPLR